MVPSAPTQEVTAVVPSTSGDTYSGVQIQAAAPVKTVVVEEVPKQFLGGILKIAFDEILQGNLDLNRLLTNNADEIRFLIQEAARMKHMINSKN